MAQVTGCHKHLWHKKWFTGSLHVHRIAIGWNPESVTGLTWVTMSLPAMKMNPSLHLLKHRRTQMCFYFITIRAQKNDISTNAISFKICWRIIPFTLKLQVLISNVGFTECHLHHPQFITIFMGDWNIKEPSPNIYIYNMYICIYQYIIGFPTLFQWSNYPFIIHYCWLYPMINQWLIMITNIQR